MDNFFTGEPLFVLSNLLWGVGAIVLSIIISIATWRVLKQLFGGDQKLRAGILWLINLGIFMTGIWLITKAFPRVSPGIVIAVLVFSVLIISVGGAVSTQKAKEGGAEGGEEKGEK